MSPFSSSSDSNTQSSRTRRLHLGVTQASVSSVPMPDTSHETASSSVPTSSRIKRNTACTSCRDAKVRCNPSLNPARPCQRCAKLRLRCVVDRAHKRVSRKSKLDELVQEIQSIKQSVSGQTTASPNQAAAYNHQNETITPFKESVPPRLGVPSPVSISTGELSAPIITSSNATIAPSSVIHTPETPIALQNPATEPALPRALGSQPFSGEDIDYYFQKYFECYHPYFPIIRLQDPNKCYESCPFLFWVIIYIASRRYAKTTTLFPFLLDAIKKDAFSTMTSWPLTLPAINAFILLCAWIFPDVRFVNDPSALFTGAVMNAILQLGIHCGKGNHPEYSHGVFQNTFTDEEAAFTWAGYNIISQRVSSSLGLPTIGGLFNQTIQNIIDGRTPFQVPPTFRVLLECQKFCNHVSRTMAACLEESRGVSAQLVLLLEDEWNAVRGLICSERADTLDRFNALLVQLEIQTYYMIPLPGYDAEALKRNIMRTYSTARAVIRDALELDARTDFLRHLPHFYFRALMSAGGIIYRILRSSYLGLVDRDDAERSAADAITASRRASITDNDLPTRLGNLFESWSYRLARAAGVPQTAEEPVSSFSQRLSASVVYDCMTRWKTDHMPGCRHKCQPLSTCPCFGSGAAANGQLANPTPGAAAGGTGGARSETPALLGGAGGGVDALQNIDWTFMDDFDWSFEPVMPVIPAPT